MSGVRNANVGIALYAASKAAVISLTRSAAMEYAPAKIRINAVSPGRILTPMMLASKIADMDAVAAGLPVRRMGGPEEVAEAVLWLASDAAAFVVGHNLCVDGGFLRNERRPRILRRRRRGRRQIGHRIERPRAAADLEMELRLVDRAGGADPGDGLAAAHRDRRA